MSIGKRELLSAMAWMIAAAPMGAGCSTGAKAETPTEREVVVFAAASLRDVFTNLADKFRAERPGVKVTLSFAGSQELAAQLEHGASADVIAAADVAHVERLAKQKLAAPPTVFACNEPVVIVPIANPGSLVTFSDLPKAKRVVIGTSAVPIGKYSEEILIKANAGNPAFSASVMSNVASREMTVKHVLTKVAMGEADAGIVYRTDAAGSKQVKVIEIPKELNVTARYPISVLVKAKAPELAEQWKTFVTSGAGRAVLQSSGFGCPN